MLSTIRLTKPRAGDHAPRRLNMFPGRYLSEREFERLQAYPEDRLAPLLATLPPGIVSGLEVRPDPARRRIRILPGRGIAAGGRLIRLATPLDVDWNDLLSIVERPKPGDQNKIQVANGFHLLAVKSLVVEADLAPDADPWTRTELDPTRDRRWEVLTVPWLTPLAVPDPWLGLPLAKVCARIAASFVEHPPLDPLGGALSLALVRVHDRQAVWINPLVGRLLCEPEAAVRSFRRFTEAHLRSWSASQPEGDPTKRLDDQLGLDVLPAAVNGFPKSLIKNIATAKPTLGFDARDLRVDLVPVPASTLPAVLEQEQGRGTLDLGARRGDHLRLLLAIPDLDYRIDLLDLPQRDLELERQLFRLGERARRTWIAWRLQWQRINRLAPTLDPDKEVPAPPLPPAVRDGLVTRREKALADKEPLPEPYISHKEHPYGLIPYTAAPETLPGESLAEKRKRLTDELNALEDVREQGRKLLAELDAHLQLHRQQLDTLAISFSTLAGGVAGDGSGADLLRWSPNARLQPPTA